jgi:hypothetical protein
VVGGKREAGSREPGCEVGAFHCSVPHFATAVGDFGCCFGCFLQFIVRQVELCYFYSL